MPPAIVDDRVPECGSVSHRACGNTAVGNRARPDAGPASAAYDRSMMSGYDMTGWGWFGMAVMVIVTIAIVALVARAISSRRPEDETRIGRTARERLDARLADGEIDTDEYRDRLEALTGHGHAR